MALPTGTISLSQVNTELGRPATQSINMNDGAVRSLAGRSSGAISMNDLRGKSSGRIEIAGGFTPQVAGGSQSNERYDRGTFSIARFPNTMPMPTSYVWFVNDSAGQLMQSGSGTGATLSLQGPVYNQFDFNTRYSVVVGCTAVINGVSYYAERTFNYTVGGGG